MSKLSMISYLMQNGWKMLSQNYVVHDSNHTRPMEIIQAYITQKHRERIAAYEAAQEKFQGVSLQE